MLNPHPFQEPHNIRYGGFWQRLAAFLIDQCFLLAFSWCLLMVVIFFFEDEITGSPSLDSLMNLSLAFQGMYLSLHTFYFIYFHGTTGQTIGKKIAGLKVIRLNGEPMTMGIAFLRWAGYLLSALVFYLGFLWIAIDPRKQGWHDKIAATCVIKIRHTRPLPPVAPHTDFSQASVSIPPAASSEPHPIKIPHSHPPDFPATGSMTGTG